MKNEEPLATITIRIYAADLELLRTLHPRLGYNKVIRQLVHNYVRGVVKRLKLEELDGNLE